MLFEHQISTPHTDFYNITSKVRVAITKSGVTDEIAAKNFTLKTRKY